MYSDIQWVLRECHCLPGPEQGARGADAQKQLECEEERPRCQGDKGVLVKEPRSNSDSDSGLPRSQQTTGFAAGMGVGVGGKSVGRVGSPPESIEI